jgi:hypothetical protein
MRNEPAPQEPLTPFIGTVSTQMMSVLSDRGAPVLFTYAAALDLEGRVHSALAGPHGAEDLASLRMCESLLQSGLANAPTAIKPYLVSAMQSLQAALGVREEAEVRNARGLH